jgi:hypothetical protein
MKNILKTLMFVAFLGSSNMLLAKDNESTILLSKDKQNLTLDFLNTNNVIGMQFDIKGINKGSVKLDSCLSGLPKTHTGKCAYISNGNLRVLIFSTTNAILDSGSIGSLNIKGDMNKISFEKVIMVGPKSKKVKANTLIDIDSDVKFFKEEKTK